MSPPLPARLFSPPAHSRPCCEVTPAGPLTELWGTELPLLGASSSCNAHHILFCDLSRCVSPCRRTAPRRRRLAVPSRQCLPPSSCPQGAIQVSVRTGFQIDPSALLSPSGQPNACFWVLHLYLIPIISSCAPKIDVSSHFLGSATP